MSKVDKCQMCGKLFEKGKGAISRIDNKIEICADCGTIQALKQWEDVLTGKVGGRND